jgi:hypothetical protein
MRSPWYKDKDMKILAIFIACGVFTSALGQSVPNGSVSTGQVWTPSQWNTAWQAKVDVSSGSLTNPAISNPTITNPTITGGNANLSSSMVDGVPVATTSSPAFSGTVGITGTMGIGITPPAINTVGLTILGTPNGSTAGRALLKVGIATGNELLWTSNPAANNWVALYPYINSSGGRNQIWPINPVVDFIAGTTAQGFAAEFDLNNNIGTAGNPATSTFRDGVLVASGGAFAPDAAFRTFSQTLANRWNYGIWFDDVGGQAGSTLIKMGGSNVNVDYGLDLSPATINFQGVRVGPTTASIVAPIAAAQFSNGGTALVLQRFTDTACTGNFLSAHNAANSQSLASIDCNGNINAVANVSARAMVSIGTAFTVSGCGTSGSVTGGSSAGFFTVGAGASPCTFVITLPRALHGWVCNADDATSVTHLVNSGTADITACTVKGNAATGDLIVFSAIGY